MHRAACARCVSWRTRRAGCTTCTTCLDCTEREPTKRTFYGCVANGAAGGCDQPQCGPVAVRDVGGQLGGDLLEKLDAAQGREGCAAVHGGLLAGCAP